VEGLGWRLLIRRALAWAWYPGPIHHPPGTLARPRAWSAGGGRGVTRFGPRLIWRWCRNGSAPGASQLGGATPPSVAEQSASSPLPGHRILTTPACPRGAGFRLTIAPAARHAPFARSGAPREPDPLGGQGWSRESNFLSPEDEQRRLLISAARKKKSLPGKSFPWRRPGSSLQRKRLPSSATACRDLRSR